MAETREESRAGFDLVMVRERDGWMCSVYRKGGQVPLRRKLVETDAAAERFFSSTLAGQ